MSLIISARYKNGILLAADPFYFNNDGEVPLKGINFDKFVFSDLCRFAIVGVGSMWVLDQLHNCLHNHHFQPKNLLPHLASKWREFNQEWKTKRQREIAEADARTLRPISDSRFIFATSDDLSKIQICDSEGNLNSTSTFFLCGSGSDLVWHFLKSTNQQFSPTDDLGDCLELVWKCYSHASNDLYVVGLPSLFLLTNKTLINFNNICSEIFNKTRVKYFTDLTSTIMSTLT